MVADEPSVARWCLTSKLHVFRHPLLIVVVGIVVVIVVVTFIVTIIQSNDNVSMSSRIHTKKTPNLYTVCVCYTSSRMIMYRIELWACDRARTSSTYSTHIHALLLACTYIHVCPFFVPQSVDIFYLDTICTVHTIFEGFFFAVLFLSLSQHTIPIWMSLVDALFHFISFRLMSCYYCFFIYIYLLILFLFFQCCCLFVSFVSYEKIEQNLRSYSTRIVILIV